MDNSRLCRHHTAIDPGGLSWCLCSYHPMLEKSQALELNNLDSTPTHVLRSQ